MKTIAVAGGTGGVGRTIVDGLLEYAKHRVVILSREARPMQSETRQLVVDYDNIDDMARTLETADVSIVICAISVHTTRTNEAQKNLIRAAGRSSCTQRFVISSFDMLHREEDVETWPLSRFTFEAIDELDKTSLIYTRIANGWFLDYYGMPAWKSHLEPWIDVLNMRSKWAMVPGGKDVQASFLTSQDMSRFVARLMDLTTWSKISAIKGHTVSFGELIACAEQARGCQFQVVIDSEEKLRSGRISFFPDYPPIGYGEGDEAFYAMIHYLAAIGRYLVPSNLRFLDDDFPEINMTSPQEVMDVGWKSV